MFHIKRRFILILLLIAVFIGVYAIVYVRQSKTGVVDHILPSIEIAQIDLMNLSSTQADLMAHIKLYNQVPVPISIDSVSYEVFIADKKIAANIYAEPIHLKADGHSVVKIAVGIDYQKLNALFERLHQQGKDSATMRIQAVLYSELIPVDSAHVTIKANIPVFLMPKLEVKKINLEKLLPSDTRLNIDVMVKNDNKQEFSFSDFKYTIKLEEHTEITNVIPGIIKIPAKDSTSVTIPVKFNFKDINRTLGDYIKEGKKLHYDITIVTKPQTTIYSLKNSEITLHSNGEIGTILKAGKK